MKTLELNQMESVQGGMAESDFACGFGVAFGAVAGFALGGPAGSVWGAMLGSTFCATEAY